MAKSISKKTFAVFTSALLLCALGLLALVPKSAHAAQANSASLTAQVGDESLAAQAAKKKVYLRKSVNGAKCTYDKNGLLTKITSKNSRTRFKYSGKKLVKAEHGLSSYRDIAWTVKYDKKGRVRTVTVKSGMLVDLYNNTETYYYNRKNQATKKVVNNKISGKKTTTKYYYNAAGQVKKIVMPEATDILKYDKKGNATKWVRKPAAGSNRSEESNTYENSYKSGRLVKIVHTDKTGYSRTENIKYAKKSIPRKYASTVAAQQKALRQFIPGSMISLLS